MDGQDTNEQSSEFVERVDSMTSEERSANFFDLFNEVLEIYPEDKK